MRPAGDVFLEMESLIDELIDSHGFQAGDIINWVHGHLKIHRPDCFEVYVDDSSNPMFFYGPTEGLDAVFSKTKSKTRRLKKKKYLPIGRKS